MPPNQHSLQPLPAARFTALWDAHQRARGAVERIDKDNSEVPADRRPAANACRAQAGAYALVTPVDPDRPVWRMEKPPTDSTTEAELADLPRLDFFIAQTANERRRERMASVEVLQDSAALVEAVAHLAAAGPYAIPYGVGLLEAISEGLSLLPMDAGGAAPVPIVHVYVPAPLALGAGLPHVRGVGPDQGARLTYDISPEDLAAAEATWGTGAPSFERLRARFPTVHAIFSFRVGRDTRGRLGIVNFPYAVSTYVGRFREPSVVALRATFRKDLLIDGPYQSPAFEAAIEADPNAGLVTMGWFPGTSLCWALVDDGLTQAAFDDLGLPHSQYPPVEPGQPARPPREVFAPPALEERLLDGESVWPADYFIEGWPHIPGALWFGLIEGALFAAGEGQAKLAKALGRTRVARKASPLTAGEVVANLAKLEAVAQTPAGAALRLPLVQEHWRCVQDALLLLRPGHRVEL